LTTGLHHGRLTLFNQTYSASVSPTLETGTSDFFISESQSPWVKSSNRPATSSSQ